MYTPLCLSTPPHVIIHTEYLQMTMTLIQFTVHICKMVVIVFVSVFASTKVVCLCAFTCNVFEIYLIVCFLLSLLCFNFLVFVFFFKVSLLWDCYAAFVKLLPQPSIAQLVERWTVVCETKSRNP